MPPAATLSLSAPAPPGSALATPAARMLRARIGRTPLVPLAGLVANPAVEVWAKAEFLNLSGSVKDRAAWAMVQAGLASGALTPERTLLDATSGNTGIAYAMIGAALGLRVALALPANASPERKRILEAYGAELILTDPLEGTDGAQDEARRRADAEPGRYHYPDQYNHPANPRAHEVGTAAEVWQQTSGRVTHFVAGLGTTGTFVGTMRGLKARNPKVVGVAMQPDGPLHGMEGLKHLPTAKTPGIYDPDLPDEHVTVTTDEAFQMARRLAREYGLFVGVSAGSNVAAAQRVAERLDSGLVVTVLCDGGERYLSNPMWEAA
ncbi:MAG: cysteine synthase family protein [Rhodothermales bacterium]|nr:cysteine synthase family protein [Rhodothermales bacterium]